MQTLAAALLPAGLMDVLPPVAAFEARTVERLMAHFAGFGYERVKPPLIEFEETMLAGSGAALAAETFRLMDPIWPAHAGAAPRHDDAGGAHRRQPAGHRPRPLRLGYAGQVMRVRGSQLRPERQFGQVGAEIVGCAAAAADVEVIIMATTALAELGVGGLTVDLGMPTLVPAIIAAAPLGAADERRLRLALDRKDIAAIPAMAPVLGAGPRGDAVAPGGEQRAGGYGARRPRRASTCRRRPRPSAPSWRASTTACAARRRR